jgi:AraC-like DNA-binding protein
MSLRTLHRRLAEERTSYRAIVDDVRAELACEYLSEADVPLSEVAARLGFSHVNAFRRAFRRWTSQRPTDLRRKLRDR